jgi:selT/selW/selH-like putative selenoprotein
VIKKAYPTATCALRKTGGGVFEVTVDGRLVWSKQATGQFPDEKQLLAGIGGARLP